MNKTFDKFLNEKNCILFTLIIFIPIIFAKIYEKEIMEYILTTAIPVIWWLFSRKEKREKEKIEKEKKQIELEKIKTQKEFIKFKKSVKIEAIIKPYKEALGKLLCNQIIKTKIRSYRNFPNPQRRIYHLNVFDVTHVNIPSICQNLTEIEIKNFLASIKNYINTYEYLILQDIKKNGLLNKFNLIKNTNMEKIYKILKDKIKKSKK